MKGAEPCSIKVYGKHLTPILNAIDHNASPVLHLIKDDSIIITTKKASWMLQPIASE